MYICICIYVYIYIYVHIYERRGITLKRFKDVCLKAKARIWPWLSYTCRIRSTADLVPRHLVVATLHPKPGVPHLQANAPP